MRKACFLKLAQKKTKGRAKVKDSSAPSAPVNTAVDEEKMKLLLKTFFIHILN
jgi:hypothetical protein